MNNVVEILLQQKLKEEISFKIFFFGLAKNTGKTTTFNYVSSLLHKLSNRTIVLLSTGYDGETLDAINGISKPEVIIREGDMFVTAEELITQSASRYQLIVKLPIKTPFGKAIIAKAVDSFTNPLITLGNNKNIRDVLSLVEKIIDNPIFLLDGSINRKAFLSLGGTSDLTVLSTGAAFSLDVQQHVQYLSYYKKLFSVSNSRDESCIHKNIIDKNTAETLKSKKLVVPNISCVFLQPISFKKFLNAENELFFEQLPAPICFITINPYNPNGSPIDEQEIVKALKVSLHNTPIVNIHKLDDAKINN